jgi:hypothetical protein
MDVGMAAWPSCLGRIPGGTDRIIGEVRARQQKSELDIKE